MYCIAPVPDLNLVVPNFSISFSILSSTFMRVTFGYYWYRICFSDGFCVSVLCVTVLYSHSCHSILLCAGITVCVCIVYVIILGQSLVHFILVCVRSYQCGLLLYDEHCVDTLCYVLLCMFVFLVDISVC